MTTNPEPPLPRPSEDPERLRRLRADALRRLEQEDRPEPVTIYGGPPMSGSESRERPEPAPVYGGPSMGGGGGRVTRRLTLVGLLLVLIGGVGAIIAWLLGRKSPAPPAPVYGGPPPANPQQ